MKSDVAKLVICVALDVIDFTALSWVPGIGLTLDAVNALIAVLFWGPVGLFALWEAANLADPIDSFVPTMTLIAITQIGKARKRSGPPELPRA